MTSPADLKVRTTKVDYFSGDGTIGGFCATSLIFWISSSSKIRFGTITEMVPPLPR